SIRRSKSLQTSTTDLESVFHGKEKKMLSEVLGKLELIENVVENQSQIIGDQEAKLQALENTVKGAHDALQTLKQPSSATTSQYQNKDTEESKEASLSRIFDSIFQEKTKSVEESAKPSQVLQAHAETLKNHEERLKCAIDKIESIWDTIMNDKERPSTLKNIQNELKDVKKLVESLRKNHDALKTESHDELETQQRLLDNLFSGFVVAFLLLVFICMFHK
ncbi:hypothetical protein QZH41_017775, partial [Actinostola sp. cb2023]